MIQVLCIDDEAAFLNLIKIFLEDTGGFAVDTAGSAKEAMKKLSARHYDALVSDYSMPETDGLELLREVRAKDDGVPFIIFSGRSREEVIIEAYNGGASFFVQKGNDVDSQFVELSHKIRQAVARYEAEERLRTRELQARMAIDLARIASWEFDLRTNVFQFDDLFYELMGTTADREGGHSMDVETYLREFIHPDDRERSLKFMQSGSADWPSEFLQTEHRIVRRDGEVREIVVRVVLQRDSSGRAIKVVGVNQDVTKR